MGIRIMKICAESKRSLPTRSSRTKKSIIKIMEAKIVDLVK